MVVSSPQVQKFLLELIESASYPGKIVEFVSAVKQEVIAAKIERPVSSTVFEMEPSDD